RKNNKIQIEHSCGIKCVHSQYCLLVVLYCCVMHFSPYRAIAMSASSSGSLNTRSSKCKQPTSSVQSGNLSTNAESFCHDASFPTSFHLSSKRSIRRRLLSQSNELSHPKSSAPASNMCLGAAPAGPQQTDSKLPAKRCRKRQLLESTSDFPTDFAFSSSSRVRSRQIQSSSDYPLPQTPTATQADYGSATSSFTHRREASAFMISSHQMFCSLFNPLRIINHVCWTIEDHLPNGLLSE
ncbi:hypothetical protein EJB05_13603, partial [Eragrostis curvula]